MVCASGWWRRLFRRQQLCDRGSDERFRASGQLGGETRHVSSHALVCPVPRIGFDDGRGVLPRLQRGCVLWRCLSEYTLARGAQAGVWGGTRSCASEPVRCMWRHRRQADGVCELPRGQVLQRGVPARQLEGAQAQVPKGKERGGREAKTMNGSSAGSSVVQLSIGRGDI